MYINISFKLYILFQFLINKKDVLWALTAMGFDNYAGPLKIYLKKYREVIKGPEITIKKQKILDNMNESISVAKKKKKSPEESESNVILSESSSSDLKEEKLNG